MSSTENKISVNVDKLTPNDYLVKGDRTTQLTERRITRQIGNALRPPYDPDRLASFLELNETHSMSVQKKAQWEVGFGFDLGLVDEVDADDADEQQEALARKFWFGEESRWLAGPEGAEPTTPIEVKELARQDYHSIGWCCLEILTRNDGAPIGLAHIPARTVRHAAKKVTDEDGEEIGRAKVKGYVQIKQNKTRYFGEPGDRYRGLEPQIKGEGEDVDVTYARDDTDEEPLFVDADTGDHGTIDEIGEPANELIFIRNPSPLATWYGIPDWISAIRTIIGDEAAKDYNLDFFEFDTIPRMVIKVTGGELTEESREDLEELIYDNMGEGHRAVVLEVEKYLEAEIDEEVDIEIIPLGQGVSEEMDFIQFRQENEHDIAKVHEVPPILYNRTGDSNRANSKEQIHSFATETIAPEQHKFGGRLHEILHKTAFGITHYRPEYTLKGADRPRTEAQIANEQINAVNGAVTIEEGRDIAGLGPLPEDAAVDGNTLIADVGASPEGPEFALTLEEQLPPEENKIGERDWAEVESALEVENGVAQKDPIEEVQFDSSNLNEGLFDFEENELYLSFLREDGPNSLYVYVNVPTAEWSGLMNASSHGSYHYSNIRMDYGYLEITNHHDRLPEGPAPSGDDVPEGVPGGISASLKRLVGR